MRTLLSPALVSVALAVAVGLPKVLEAQSVRCHAIHSADGTYRGACVSGDSAIAQLNLQGPSSAKPHYWRGTAALTPSAASHVGARGSPAEMIVDVRPGGALRLGRAWLELREVKSDRAALEFEFTFGGAAAANEVDVGILRLARVYLADTAHWSNADTTDMGAAPTRGFACAPAARQSMFCALYLASLEVSGDYAHFRPAINAVRQAVATASKGSYRHPLVDFNNDPARVLDDVHAVLNAALLIVEQERAKRGA